MPCSSTWIALVSCPPMSSTVRVPGNIACAPRPWQRISERICSFGKGSVCAPVAGADTAATCRARIGRHARHGPTPSARPAHRSQRERGAGVALEGALDAGGTVLDLEDRLVEQADETVEARPADSRGELGSAMRR